MNSVTKTHAERTPKSSSTRDEFRRVGGIGALKLAARAERALISAQIRRETGNPEMAKELAILSIREYLLKGMVEEARLAAKAFGIPEGVLKAEAESAINGLKGKKAEFPAENKSALSQLYLEFGPRAEYINARAAIAAKRISKTTSAAQLYTDIDFNIAAAGDFLKISDSELETYFLALATELATGGDILGANYLLDKAGLHTKKQEVAEQAIAALKEMGEDTEAYNRFSLLAKAGFFKGINNEQVAEILSSLLCDSLLCEIRNGEYGNVQKALGDASKHGIIYAPFAHIDLIANTFSSLREGILYPSAEQK